MITKTKSSVTFAFLISAWIISILYAGVDDAGNNQAKAVRDVLISCPRADVTRDFDKAATVCLDAQDMGCLAHGVQFHGA